MNTFPYAIRPIRAEEDSAEIAHLIRVSFSRWLDKGNLDYLSSMEAEGLRYIRHPLIGKLIPFPFPQQGVVCTDAGGRILGVINFYDFHLNGEPCSLLANICVDPDHRREGIASRMLAEAERIRTRDGISDLFLQARVEMPETVEFYRKRGFRVTDYRENRILPGVRPSVENEPDYHLERVPESDLEFFRKRMDTVYPPTILWNLNYRSDLFSTDLMTEILNRLGGSGNKFRRVLNRDGKVLVWTAFQKLNGFTDQMWFIPNTGLTDADCSAVLRFLCAGYKGKRPLKLDVPTGRPAEVYESAGLILQQTLAWMWKKL